MKLPSSGEISAARELVYHYMPPTPQYSWPLLNRRLGAEVWVKHENHTPVGAFKLRGTLIYLDWLKNRLPDLEGVVSATRGNFGQGVAMAARLLGMKAVIVVPRGNSTEKNQAILAQGAELVEQGHDFQASFDFARSLAAQRGFEMVDSFHEQLVLGTAGLAMEFLENAPALEVVYAPIGLGSSICGMAAARNALGLNTEIVGVVAQLAPGAAISFRQKAVVEAPANTLIADGVACRRQNAEALEIMLQNVSRIIEISEAGIAEAMLACYQDTHNLAEGAGAISLAGAISEKESLRGKRVGVVLTGGNVDRETFASILMPALQPVEVA